MRKCDRTIFRKEQIITVWYNMANMPIGNHKKPVWKGCVWCNSTSMTFWKSKTLLVGENQWLGRLSWKRVFIWQWTILCDFIVVAGMFALEDKQSTCLLFSTPDTKYLKGWVYLASRLKRCVPRERQRGGQKAPRQWDWIAWAPPSIHCRGTGRRDRQKGPEAGSVSHASLHITSFS